LLFTGLPTALELGCGTGLLSLTLAPHVSSLLAIDASSGMIRALDSKLAQPQAPRNIRPLCIMLEDPDDPRLPDSAGSIKSNASSTDVSPRQRYDLVLSHLVLHHIPDMSAFLTTMFGCLKSGGRLAVTDFEDFGPEARKFHPESKMEGVERHGIPRAEIEHILKKIGYVDVQVEVGWTMRKEIEAWPGEWGSKRPTKEERGGKALEEQDFPFLIMLGTKP